MLTSLTLRSHSPTSRSRWVVAPATPAWPTWPAVEERAAPASVPPSRLHFARVATARETLRTATRIFCWPKKEKKTQEKGDIWQPNPPGHSNGALNVARFATTRLAASIQPVAGGSGISAAGWTISQVIHFSSTLTKQHLRQLLSQTWQHSPRRMELPDAGNPNSWRHFPGRRGQHLPGWVDKSFPQKDILHGAFCQRSNAAWIAIQGMWRTRLRS